MTLAIFSEGKEYISAIRAAEKSGYSSDYIGQLCRSKKIPGKLIGKTWYVEFPALISHKNHKKNKKGDQQSLTPVDTKAIFSEAFSYSPEEFLLLPPLSKTRELPRATEKAKKNNPHHLRVATLALSIIFLTGLGYSAAKEISPLAFSGGGLVALSPFENIGQLFSDGWNNLKNLALGTSSEKIYSTPIESAPSKQIPTQTKAVTQTSEPLNLSAFREDLKSELERYILLKLDSVTPAAPEPEPPFIYNPNLLRRDIASTDTHPIVSRQSETDTDRVSQIIEDILDGGTFTNATISGTNAQFDAVYSDIANIQQLTVASCTGCGSGGGSSFAWPWTTLSTNEQATSTTIAFLNGFLSTASSTLQNFTAASGTVPTLLTSNATTTNLHVSGLASTTELRANTVSASVATSSIISSTAAGIGSLLVSNNLISTGATSFVNLLLVGSSTLQSFTGTNYLALGSTTLQNFTAASGTMTRLLASNATTTTFHVSGLSSTTNFRANSAIVGNLTAGSVINSSLAGSGTRCLQTDNNGLVSFAAAACGSGGSGGASGGTWSTTTSQVAGQFINYSNNNTDIIAIGNFATTSAPYFFDPNLVDAFLTNVRITKSTTTEATTTNLFISGLASSTEIRGNIVRSGLSTSTFVTANDGLISSLSGNIAQFFVLSGTEIGAGNLLVLSSTTLQNFTASNSTTTNATSTNLFISGLASTTNLRANIATFGLSTSTVAAATLGNFSVLIGNSLTFSNIAGTTGLFGNITSLGSSTLQAFTASNSTTTSATSTNLSISGLASTTNLRANSAVFGDITVGSCTGCGGSSFAWPWTKQADGAQATSTLIEFFGGIYTNASSTLASTTVTTLLSTNATTTNFYVSGLASTTDFRSNTAILGNLTAGSVTNSSLAGSGTKCLQTDNNGLVSIAAAACGSAGGAAGTWSTTTSQVAGQFINYSNNTTDIVAIGNSATTSAPIYFDPNLSLAKIFNQSFGSSSSTLQAFTGTNYLALGSTTLQAFTASSGTIPTLLASNATTTNFYVSGLASTTELRANTVSASVATSSIISSTAAGIGSLLVSNNLISTGVSSFVNLLVVGSSTLQAFTGTNYLALGSTTLQNFTAASGTMTRLLSGNATSTNLFVSRLASTTELRANTGSIGLLVGTNAIFTGLTFSSNFLANASSTLQAFTGTNYLALGSTTLQAFTASSGTIPTLLASNATTTNFYVSGLASTTNFRANSSVFGDTTSIFASFTNALFNGSTTLQNFTASNATTSALAVTGSVNLYGIGNDAGTAYICTTLATGIISTSTTACNPSSLKYKENISDLSYGLAEVLDLRPVSYDYKPELLVKGRQVGFIAEEMYQVIPEVVGLKNGQPDNIDYAKLTSVLAKAIKDLYSEFSSLKETVLALADRVVSREIMASEKVCIGNTCINEQQLINLLNQSGQSYAYPSPASPPAPSNEPPAEPTEEPEPGESSIEESPAPAIESAPETQAEETPEPVPAPVPAAETPAGE